MNGSIRRVRQHAAAVHDDQLPRYIYDLGALKAHAREVRAIVPDDIEIFYAAKANPDAEILRALSSIVDGFEASSAGETAHIAASVADARIAVGGPGKSPADLRSALRHDADRLHVESTTELHRLAAAAAENSTVVPVLLRVNLADVPTDLDSVALAMAGRATPFGMDAVDITRCLEALPQLPSLRFAGIHAHVASGLDADAHIAVSAAVLRYVEALEAAHGIRVDEVNLGGGMAVSYDPDGVQFDWARWAEGIQLLRVGAHAERRLRIEPGRVLTAWCGYYATKILDVKRSHGEEIVVVAGGTHHLRTPAARRHDQPAQVIAMADSEAPRVAQSSAQLVGQLCTPKDMLSRRAPLQGAGLGDRVLLSMAGAYAWNISHHGFLMHPAPTVQYLHDEPACV